jgi:hypothetical protein
MADSIFDCDTSQPIEDEMELEFDMSEIEAEVQSGEQPIEVTDDMIVETNEYLDPEAEPKVYSANVTLLVH